MSIYTNYTIYTTLPLILEIDECMWTLNNGTTSRWRIINEMNILWSEDFINLQFLILNLVNSSVNAIRLSLKGVFVFLPKVNVLWLKSRFSRKSMVLDIYKTTIYLQPTIMNSGNWIFMDYINQNGVYDFIGKNYLF